MSHPMDQVRTHWETSKKCWDECEVCGKTLNRRGFNTSKSIFWDNDLDGSHEEENWCFVGLHTTDRDLVRREGWGSDESESSPSEGGEEVEEGEPNESDS